MLLREMTETLRKSPNLARPSKVQIVVSMVCKLVKTNVAVLTTANGALRRRSVEGSLDSPSQWQQVVVGGSSRLVRRGCKRLGYTDTSLGLDGIGGWWMACMLRAVDQEVCFRAAESKEVTRQDLHELHAGQAKKQTACLLTLIHVWRMLVDTGPP
jgi:hypothetical protein